MEVLGAFETEASVVLAALYARGRPGRRVVSAANWSCVLSALRRRPCEAETSSGALSMAGLWVEAAEVAHTDLVRWARARINATDILTPVSPLYPRRWLDVLGERAPAAIWVQGDGSQLLHPSWIGAVGSRSVDASTIEFAEGIGLEAERMGCGVVSGAAYGCDSAAAGACRSVGGAVVEILPFGFDLANGFPRGVWLSVCAPSEPFRAATAMERNALIYAFAPHTVVCHARYRQGGTWHGAVEAHRRRLTRLVVRDLPNEPGHRALISLGGVPLSSPAGLDACLVAPPSQVGLFCLA